MYTIRMVYAREVCVIAVLESCLDIRPKKLSFLIPIYVYNALDVCVLCALPAPSLNPTHFRTDASLVHSTPGPIVLLTLPAHPATVPLLYKRSLPTDVIASNPICPMNQNI